MSEPVPSSTKVLVIGAGVHGLSTAWHLAQRGEQVLVLDKTAVAAGASGIACGVVRNNYFHDMHKPDDPDHVHGYLEYGNVGTQFIYNSVANCDYGLDAKAGRPQDFAAFMSQETVRWGEIVKKTGVRFD